MPKLIAPDPRVRTSYLTAAGEVSDGLRARLDLDALADPAAFELYCRALAAGSLEWQHTYAGGRMRVLWWCQGEEYLGESTIRPDLTPEYGSHPTDRGLPIRLVGHVGYEIRESARRQGHGRALLRATLQEANRIGIDPVVLTVGTSNAASIRIIESCGGRRFTAPADGVVQYLATGADL
ncbi:MAG: N-acetyltransferase [Streptosporangiaceae bacterium]|nr:N-acetyltransferase [Streptosporangiaceae bacterium]